MDSLAIQRSLTVLEERFSQLRDAGEKRFQNYASELRETQEHRDHVQSELKATQEHRDHVQHELEATKEEMELLRIQLWREQEQSDHYLIKSHELAIHSQALENKLTWLRNQRVLLIRMLHRQQSALLRFRLLFTKAVNTHELAPRGIASAFLGPGLQDQHDQIGHP